MALAHFERATAPESYARALASAYFAGYRIYDPSLSASRDPEAERKMMRFPAIAAPLNVRHTSIAGRRWTISPPDEGGEKEKAAAKVCGKILGNLDGFTPARLLLVRADVSGTRYAEIQKRTISATYGDGETRQWVVPVRLKDIPKENFRWAPKTGNDRPLATLEYARKRSGTIRWVPVPTWAPLIRHVIMDSEDMLGYGSGLRDALHYVYGIMTEVFESDAKAAERLGHGWVVLKLDHEASGSTVLTNEALITQSHDRLNKMRARHNFIIGKNDTLEFLAPPSGASEWMGKFFDRMARMCDRLIMGATLFAGGGEASEGSMARAETEADTASGVFDALSDMLEETLTRDLVASVFRDNQANFNALGLGGSDHPRFEIVRGRKDDPKEVAERAEIVLRSGAKIKADEFYEGVGFTKPGPKDEVIEGPPQDAGMPGGLPGMPFYASGDRDAPLSFAEWDESKHARDAGKFSKVAGAGASPKDVGAGDREVDEQAKVDAIESFLASGAKFTDTPPDQLLSLSDRFRKQLGLAKADGRSEDAAKWSDKREAVSQVIQARRELGSRKRRMAAMREVRETGKLSIEENEISSLLSNPGDAYVDAGVIGEGQSSRGIYEPEAFITSDLSGKPIRRYVTLPDGRKGHPDEIHEARKRGRIVIVERLPDTTMSDTHRGLAGLVRSTTDE